MLKIMQAADTMELWLYDEIGDTFWGGVSAKDVVRDIAASKTPISVRINSPGGIVTEGYAIYNALSQHRHGVTVQVDGLAASIASIIAMAGEQIIMAEMSMMMIHNPWTIAVGDAREFRSVADTLEKMQAQSAGLYAKRSGMSEAEAQAAMDAETWYTAEEAVAAGLADAISSDEQIPAAKVPAGVFRHAPSQLESHDKAIAWRRQLASHKLKLLTGRRD